MKFRAKKPNNYKELQWIQGVVEEFTKKDVEDAIAKGWNTTEASVKNMERRIELLVEEKRKEIEIEVKRKWKVGTNKPVSALLNHWEPTDKESKEMTAEFYKNKGRVGEVKHEIQS